MSSDGATYRNIVSVFIDFVTVAIHTILYERTIYPQTSFLSVRKYNFPVHQNRHPKVCEWINDAVSSLEAELLKCTVDRVAVVIFTKANKPVERYVFDVSRLPTVPFADLDTPLERSTSNGEKSTILPLVNVEEQLRGTMSKLANCGSSLKELLEGCSFTLAIELKDSGEPPLSHPQQWIPVQPQKDAEQAHEKTKPRATPVRNVGAGELTFEMWIEEVGDRDDGH